MKIFKYVLETDREMEIEMPVGEIIECREQDNRLCIWVYFRDEMRKEVRRFIPVVTGVEFEGGTYVGTCHLDNGKFVVHIFSQL